MRIPNPTKHLPAPNQLVDLAKRAGRLIPALRGGGEEPEAAPPPRPAAAPPPKPAARPEPVANAKATPRAAAKPTPKSKPKPKPKGKAKAKPNAKSAGKPKRSKGQPKTAPPGVAVSGFPEPPGKDPGDLSKHPNPHRVLNTPVGDPDPTEWPDPYDTREDPRDPPDPDREPFGENAHPVAGARSTSDPHPAVDPDAEGRREKLERDKLDN